MFFKIIIPIILIIIAINYVTKKNVFFAKVNPTAIIPSKSRENAGYDIYSNFEEDYIVIPPHETKMIPTGIASAFSSRYYFQLEERGSTGTKGIGQRCGVIDSGFRGEWQIPITNHNDKYLIIAKQGITLQDIFGDTAPHSIIYPYEKAISQAVLLPVPKVNIKELSYKNLLKIESERGVGMLGHSNK